MRFFEWFSNTVLQFRKEARLEAPFLLLWKCTIFQTHWLNRVHRSRVESAKNWDWKGGLLLFFLHTRANFSPKFFKCNLKAQLESFSSGRCLGISIEIAIPIVWCLARFFPIFQQRRREKLQQLQRFIFLVDLINDCFASLDDLSLQISCLCLFSRFIKMPTHTFRHFA